MLTKNQCEYEIRSNDLDPFKTIFITDINITQIFWIN